MPIVIDPESGQLTAEELVVRFKARGFDYKSDAEALEMLNDAYLLDICDAADWPFLEEYISGQAPLELEELGAIEYVIDESQGRKLKPLDRRELADVNTDFTTLGTPRRYYLTESRTLNTYPVSTDIIMVHYYKSPEPLAGDATPILPPRFHSLIIDAAVARGYEDSDDWELSQSAEAKFNSRLQKMREVLMNVYRDGPDDFITVTDPLAF